MLTAANRNTEIKLWSLDNLRLLQFICFNSNIKDEKLYLKASIDNLCSSLIISDIKKKAVYALGIGLNRSQNSIFIESLHEFKIEYPILSFYISNTSIQNDSIKVERICDDIDYFCKKSLALGRSKSFENLDIFQNKIKKLMGLNMLCIQKNQFSRITLSFVSKMILLSKRFENKMN